MRRSQSVAIRCYKILGKAKSQVIAQDPYVYFKSEECAPLGMAGSSCKLKHAHARGRRSRQWTDRRSKAVGRGVSQANVCQASVKVWNTPLVLKVILQVA
jgi:hypothetical protein